MCFLKVSRLGNMSYLRGKCKVEDKSFSVPNGGSGGMVKPVLNLDRDERHSNSGL